MPWLEPYDLSTRVSHLNGTQLHVDPDGCIRVVLAHRDPAVQNWIDTGGRTDGHLMYRWIWSEDEPIPVALVVPFDEVDEHLHANTPVFTAEQRRAQIALRRRHLARRFRQ